jgi:heme-degrading monooxygenase HmoA
MVVVVFRSRVNVEYLPELETLGAKLYEIASGMPGFISYREYASADGESVAVVEFESHEALAAWREQPDHKEAQAAGRDRYFSEYHITVCDVVRDYSVPG